MAGVTSLGAAFDINQISRGDLITALNRLDPTTREIAELGLSHSLAGTGHADRLLGKARDTYGEGPGKVIGQQNQQSLGSQPSTAGPHHNYSQKQAHQSAAKFYQPLNTDNVEMRVGGKKKGLYLTGNALNKVLNQKGDKYVGPGNPQGFKFNSMRNSLIKKYDLQKTTDGKWLAPATSSSSAAYASSFPTQKDNSVGGSTFKFLQRTSWLMPALGFMGGGIPGLIGGFIGAKALKSISGGMGAGSMAPGLAGIGGGGGGFGGGGGGIGGIGGLGAGGLGGGLGGVTNYGGMANAAQFMGLDGMAFNMRKIMNSQVEDMKDKSMINMINNPNIAIEDLIFMFMAYMGDKYEKKLREKMEEAALAEKKERKREQDKQKAAMIGGIASIIPGVGPIIGSAIQMGMQEKTRIREALDGNTKSSTILMQEVQMLMHKWKQLNEMLSNLMKAMHDMAMTPIRNIR